MAFEIGQIVDGKVTGIVNYGAFVDIGDNTSGMVHISEVAPVYVKEIKDYLTVGQEVKVKILTIDEKGKIGLSIKQAMPRPQQNGAAGGRPRTGSPRGSAPGQNRRPRGGNSDSYDWNRRQSGSENFDDMLSRFMASSEEKVSGLKKDQRRSRKGGNNGGQW